MYFIIFLLEFAMVYLYLNQEELLKTETTTSSYTSYYSIDSIGNSILSLNNLPEKEKLEVWKSSSVKEDMLYYFPNITIMQEVFQDQVEDEGAFKEAFLNYMEEMHNNHIGGLLTIKELKKALNNPPSNLIEAY